MTYAVFDLTEFTQLSIRYDTGIHPDRYSLGISIGRKEIHLHEIQEPKEKSKPIPPEFNCYDVVDWDRAVKMAKWILGVDKTMRKEEEPKEVGCPFKIGEVEEEVSE